MSVNQAVEHLIRPVLEQNRFDLVETQYLREGGAWVLRIFIDKLAEEGAAPSPVTLQDCEKASHLVSDLLDASEAVKGAYTLEVSSPGVNRALRNAKDFGRFLGQKARVSLYTPLSEGSKQRNFAGPLTAVGDRSIEIDDVVSGKTEIPIEAIAKAHLDII